MLRVLMILSLAAACGACQQADRDVPVPASADDPARQAHMTPIVAYEHACADCHDTGKDGAPRTGDPQAWADRSALWEAVLFEHAQKGYLNMPAHGLDGHFSDEEVAAAAQYMLEITHPDRPRD
ncbi:MAG TPA: c-type cytochrome [Woeseiaceae bacterium]|nr:c-type cytochrome [Woeseiaceae bacterium]